LEQNEVKLLTSLEAYLYSALSNAACVRRVRYQTVTRNLKWRHGCLEYLNEICKV